MASGFDLGGVVGGLSFFINSPSYRDMLMLLIIDLDFAVSYSRSGHIEKIGVVLTRRSCQGNGVCSHNCCPAIGRCHKGLRIGKA